MTYSYIYTKGDVFPSLLIANGCLVKRRSRVRFPWVCFREIHLFANLASCPQTPQ